MRTEPSIVRSIGRAHKCTGRLFTRFDKILVQILIALAFVCLVFGWARRWAERLAEQSAIGDPKYGRKVKTADGYRIGLGVNTARRFVPTARGDTV